MPDQYYYQNIFDIRRAIKKKMESIEHDNVIYLILQAIDMLFDEIEVLQDKVQEIKEDLEVLESGRI